MGFYIPIIRIPNRIPYLSKVGWVYPQYNELIDPSTSLVKKKLGLWLYCPSPLLQLSSKAGSADPLTKKSRNDIITKRWWKNDGKFKVIVSEKWFQRDPETTSPRKPWKKPTVESANLSRVPHFYCSRSTKDGNARHFSSDGFPIQFERPDFVAENFLHVYEALP